MDGRVTGLPTASRPQGNANKTPTRHQHNKITQMLIQNNHQTNATAAGRKREALLGYERVSGWLKTKLEPSHQWCARLALMECIT